MIHCPQGCAGFQEIFFNPCKSLKGSCVIEPCKTFQPCKIQYTVLHAWVEFASIFSDSTEIEPKISKTSTPPSFLAIVWPESENITDLNNCRSTLCVKC